MTPRYRAWIKTERCRIETDDILDIDYENKEIVTQQVYFENGLPDDRDIYCYDFDEIEFMQSTGLVDKNGKEIFWGDILRIETGCSWLEVVSYSQEKAMFVTEEVNRKFKTPESPLYELFNTNIFKLEVIGNIYENPELLEDKE